MIIFLQDGSGWYRQYLLNLTVNATPPPTTTTTYLLCIKCGCNVRLSTDSVECSLSPADKRAIKHFYAERKLRDKSCAAVSCLRKSFQFAFQMRRWHCTCDMLTCTDAIQQWRLAIYWNLLMFFFTTYNNL